MERSGCAAVHRGPPPQQTMAAGATPPAGASSPSPHLFLRRLKPEKRRAPGVRTRHRPASVNQEHDATGPVGELARGGRRDGEAEGGARVRGVRGRRLHVHRRHDALAPDAVGHGYVRVLPAGARAAVAGEGDVAGALLHSLWWRGKRAKGEEGGVRRGVCGHLCTALRLAPRTGAGRNARCE